MQSILEDDSSLELRIDEPANELLGGAAKWARIMGYVGFGAVVLVLGFLMKIYSDIGLVSSGDRGFLGAVFIIAAVIIGLILYFLVNFGTKTIRGIQSGDVKDIEAGISSLKVFFIIMGVFGMISLLLNALALLK